MAKSVGVVSKVVGQVLAVGSDGGRRLLVEGDRLFAGEQLVTGAAGAVAVRLHNGAELTLGRDSSLEMTTDLLANRAPPVQTHDTPPSQAQLSDVERLQQAIAAGADPTEEAEAPAAGNNANGAPGALGGGHTFVMLTEVAGRVDPQIGFPTAGFNGIPELANRYLGERSVDGDGNRGAPLQPPPVNPPEDHPVSLEGLDVKPGELLLDEAHLPEGSAADPSALTQHGSFTVVAPDGVFNLSVGGISVVTGGVVMGVGQSITTPLGNVLTITGYDSATGVVSYSYTLSGAEQHPNGAGSNTLGEHFPVLVSDSDGDVATGSLDVIIRDDVPKARDDTNAVTATEQHTELTGNVLANDLQGADRVPSGPVVAGTFTGTYGTLVLAADGSYTYTLNTNDPDFKNLPGGGKGVETFTYTLRDADGDTSTATLTLNVSNLDDPVTLGGLDVKGGELTVHEKHLADGSAPNPSALTQASTFTVSAPDGLQSLNVGGISVVSGGTVAGFPQSITTPLGNTLTITGYDPATGVVSYSYTLLDNEGHPNGGGNNSLQEQFTVIAKDTDGSTATGSLDVNIVDDVPTAEADTASVVEGGTVSGNVLHNDQLGADQAGTGNVVVGARAGADTSTSAIGNLNTAIVGQYGTLTIDAAGNAVYQANPNAVAPPGASDVFVYTIRDTDGDESTTTITINVNDCSLIAASDSEVTVYEKALDLLKDGNDLAAGTVEGSDPNSTGETASGSLAGSVSGGVGALTFSLVGNAVGQYGQIQLNSDGTYTYTLTSAPQSPNPGNDGPNTVTESFTYQVKDSLGNTTTNTIVITIVDDVPTAHSDFASVTEGGTVAGNVLDNDVVGADVVSDGKYVVGVRAGNDTSTSATGQLNTQVMGQYGYLTLDAQGNAVYHANPNSVAPAGATDTFVYTIRDADGDESTTTITIRIDDCSLIAGPDSEVTVHEKSLDLLKDGNDLAAGTVEGSDPNSTDETASGSLAGSVSGGVGALTFSLVGNAVGQYGQIQLNSDGTYTYTLTSAPQSPNPGNDGPNTVTESFTYQVKDSLGNTTTNTIVITIVDDVPTAHSDFASVTEGGTVAGNVLDNDMVGADVVSDGKYVVGVRAGNDTSTSATGQLNTQVMGQYGYLTLDAQGNAVYHANPNSVAPAGATDTFVYTIRDADGDESTTTITIRIDDCSLIAGPDSEVTVHEKSLDLLKDGNDLAAGTVEGSDPNSTDETASGSLAGSVSGGVGALTFSLVGNAVGQYGQIQLNSDGTYTYTLTSAPQSPNPGNDGPNTVTESFTYQVKDSLGNTTTNTIVITIVDDVPTAHSDFASVTEGGTVAGNVLDNDMVGADVVSDGKYVVGVRAGNDTSTSATGQLNTQVMGQYGYLTLDAQGNALYHANPNSVAPAGATDTFVYTIRDADGDESTTTITIRIDDCSLVVGDDTGVMVYEKSLDLLKDGNDLAAGTVEGSDPHSTGETASGSLASSVSGGVGTLTFSLVGNAVGQYGQIQLNSDGTYTYTLTSAPQSPNPGNDGPNTVTESFTYQVKDSQGNSTTSTIVITIVDDVPRAHCDETSVIEGGTVSGNVLDNDIVGADVVSDGKYVVGVRAGNDASTSATGQLNTQVMGQYGYLTLDAQGNAVYHANPNSVAPAGATDTFVYTIRDADGDESTTTITINVRDSKMVACEDRDVTVYEKALDLCKDGHDLAAGTVIGSDPHSTGETASGSLVGSVIGGVGALTYSLVGNAAGQYGQIQLNSDGTYTYTLTSAPQSPNPGNDGPNTVTESFTYQVKDSLGNTTTNSIVITIVDDVPRAHCDETSVIEGGTVSGNVLDNDVVGADVVSDGKYVVGVRAGSDTSSSATGQLNTQVMGQYGYLTLDAKGNAIYHANPNSVPPSGATDTFVYTIRDADGDESTTTITINVRDSKMVACEDRDVTVYEKALDLCKDGHDLAAGTVTGSDPHSTGETASGSLAGSVIGGVGALTYSLMDHAVGQYGQIHLNSNGTYTYTLTSAPKSPTPGNDGPNTVTESFTYQVKDSLGNTTTNSIVITIVDDVPRAHCDETSVIEGRTVTGNVLDNDIVGADVVNDGKYVVGVRAGSDTSSSATGQLNTQVMGQYGYLTLDAKGNAVYHAKPNSVPPSGATDTFVYTIRDADGDESTTTITINVRDSKMVSCWDSDTNAYQKILDLHRSAFSGSFGSMTAALVIAGYLGAISNGNANEGDVINVTLRKGETLKLDHDHPMGNLMMEWKAASGGYQAMANGDSFTASHDGVYSIHLARAADASGNDKAAEKYNLNMLIDYSHAERGAFSGSDTHNDHPGGSASATASIVYPGEHTLDGTPGDDVLVGGEGNDTLQGGDGDDLLIGGAGIDTASYASADAGVVVDLSAGGPQDTGGAGIDTLVGIENLIGSDHDDTLIGNGADNLLIAGLGNDVLKGGAGNDILIGGPGNDTLSGGSGNDTFVWQKGDTGHDTVTDFTPGSDSLDLSQLLQGESASAASLDDYLHFKVNGTGTEVVSTIEVSSVAGAAPTQTIDLAGVDLAQHYGVAAGAGGMIAAGQDTATIINGMLNDHSLKVDTV